MEEKRLQEIANQQEREAILEHAVKCEQRGMIPSAEAAFQDIERTVAPLVKLEREKIEGISTQNKWAFKVTSEAQVNRQFLCLDLKKIGSTVRAMGKDAENLIGGIEVLRETIVSSRGKL
jgi:hypothetical protein